MAGRAVTPAGTHGGPSPARRPTEVRAPALAGATARPLAAQAEPGRSERRAAGHLRPDRAVVGIWKSTQAGKAIDALKEQLGGSDVE